MATYDETEKNIPNVVDYALRIFFYSAIVPYNVERFDEEDLEKYFFEGYEKK